MKSVQIMPVIASLLFVGACSEDATTTPENKTAPITAVTVTAGATSLAPGEATQLSATATTAAGQVVSGAQFAWLSDASNVATVDATGRVTAVSPGTAAISATAGTVRGTATLTVKAPVLPSASVRFVNATTGMTGNGGFITNGKFATGSALPFGEASSCTSVNAGSTSLGFGAVNTDGTGLNGNALATLSNQSLADGGDYIVVATGSAASPTLFLLDNKFTGTLASSLAAVRFVNFAPGKTDTTANTFVVYVPQLGAGSSPFAIDMEVGAPSAYKTVNSGANAFTVMQNPGHNIVIPSGTITLQAGSVNTVAIVLGAAPGTFRTVHIPRC